MTKRTRDYRNLDVQLVPFSVQWDNDSVERVEYGRRVSMATATKAEQKAFLEALLKFKWLSPSLRRVVMRELGRSAQHERRQINEAVAGTLRHLVEERKAELRARNEKRRGGIHDAALEQVAASQGISVEALKKRLERYPDPDRN